MTDQEIKDGLVLSWMGGESYEDWKEKYIEDYLPDEPLPSDESLVPIYRDDCRLDWNWMVGELTDLIEDKFSGYWWVKVENFGWQSVHGTAEFFADTGQKFLQELLPETECYFKVFLHEQWTHRVDYVGEPHLFKGLSIQNYHHDSPVGNEWYYALDVGDLTKCVRCEKWFPEMEYYESEELGCAQDDRTMMTPIKKLTDEQKTTYLKEYEGSRCPHCASWRLESERRPFMASDMKISLYVSCQDCGERWTDHYKLHDVTARG